MSRVSRTLRLCLYSVTLYLLPYKTFIIYKQTQKSSSRFLLKRKLISWGENLSRQLHYESENFRLSSPAGRSAVTDLGVLEE